MVTGGGDIVAEAIIAAGAILTDGAAADAWAFTIKKMGRPIRS